MCGSIERTRNICSSVRLQEMPSTASPGIVANAAKAGLKVPQQPGSNMPIDSPLLQELGGPRAVRSPGVHALREAFDVSYAVHRIEEEGATRRKNQAAGGRGFLGGLNEDDEDQEQEIEETKRKYGENIASAMREQVARDQQTGKKTEQIPPSQYQGWGGANRRMAEAALYDGRAGARDRGRQTKNKNFELSLNNATLLGRRGGGATSIKPSPLSQQVAS